MNDIAIASKNPPASPRHGGASVRPLWAVGVILGQPLDLAEVRARAGREARAHGYVADHETGVAQHSLAAVTEARWILSEADGWNDAYAAACATLSGLLIEGDVGYYGRSKDGVVRRLGNGDFAADVELTFVDGRFMPRLDLELFSPEWDSARKVCDAIGDVWVDLGDVERRSRLRRRGKRAGETQARSRALELLDRWLAESGDLADAPRKGKWTRGEGLNIAGTIAAAARAWDAACDTNPTFARLRVGGRRPNKRSKEIE